MRILLYGLNFAPELTSTGRYTGEMANWLATQGHELRVVTSPPYYPSWRIRHPYSGVRYTTEQAGGLTVYRSPLYVPRVLRTANRMLHLLSFALSSIPNLARSCLWRPDAIILVVPTMLCTPQAALFARLTGALSVLHVQDFEFDALFGLGMARGRRIQRALAFIERFFLRRFDLVSTISTGMLARAKAKGVAGGRLRLFPNWSDVERFEQAAPDSALLRRLGVAVGHRVVLYSGNLGEKQGLDGILDSAENFTGSSQITFLIVGDGAGRQRLIEAARSRALTNVVFAPLQPAELFPALLASADCHLIVQRRGVADAVMPSKLTNILAAGGNAVITAEPDTSLGQLCADYPGIATLVAPESAAELSRGIRAALALPRRNSVAIEYAKRFLSKERILSDFYNEVAAAVAQKQRKRGVR